MYPTIPITVMEGGWKERSTNFIRIPKAQHENCIGFKFKTRSQALLHLKINCLSVKSIRIVVQLVAFIQEKILPIQLHFILHFFYIYMQVVVISKKNKKKIWTPHLLIY